MRRTYKKRIRRHARRRTQQRTRHVHRHIRLRTGMRGGNYDQFTDKTVDGVDVSEGTIATVPGIGTMSVRDFNEHMDYVVSQGSRP